MVDCPNCGQTMESLDLGGNLNRTIEVDLCYPCHAIWLDRMESARLAPGGILDLFEQIHGHRNEGRHPLEDDMRCPRCHDLLRHTWDRVKGVRFSYYACPSRHGRLTPFSQFLCEKQFVRSVTEHELVQMRAKIHQIRCSSCGAPVRLEGSARCGHCGSPVSILDTTAVERTLQSLTELEVERQEKTKAAVDALRELRENPLPRPRTPAPAGREPGFKSSHDLVDLAVGVIAAAIDALRR